MELVALNKIKQHFNLKYLMELFSIPEILEKIRNFRFFHHKEEIEIVEENNKFWFLTRNGLGIISKVWINEETLKVVNVLKEAFLKLIGKTTEKVKQTKDNMKEDINYTKWLFICLFGGLGAFKAYQCINKK